jgi:hypothetical protein
VLDKVFFTFEELLTNPSKVHFMNIFKKILGLSSTPDKEVDPKQPVSPYMRQSKMPLDERFMTNFKQNGGKFLYCENLDEVFSNFKFIIEENNWSDTNIQCFDKQLQEKFKNFPVKYSTDKNASFLFSACQNLIADDGSVMFCSNQINERKLNELPEYFVIFATTSQIVNNIGESLRGIKMNNQRHLPTNIISLKHFDTHQENDFMSYGSSAKNLYLLLLEDL